MYVVLRCPCGANLKADIKLVGRQMKCPRCQNSLIVPAPPTAARSAPDPNELELLDPLQMPLPPELTNPVAYAPQLAAQAARPAAARRPLARGVSKSRGSRKQFWLISGIAIGAVFLLAAGYLIWVYSSQRSKLAQDRGKFTRDPRQQSLGAFGESSGPYTGPTDPPKPNTFDSGNRELYDASVMGSEQDLAMADLIERVEPSIVRIKVTTPEGEGVGSGFFIDREGKIVTNSHVIQLAGDVLVSTADGRQTKALGYIIDDPQKDLAIIQIDPKDLNIVPIPIARELPRRGEKVAAFGAPAGFSFSATEGIISSIRTGVDVRDTLSELINEDIYASHGYTIDMNWIQLTAAISGGNSGGPLVNMRGELVGVNTWTYPGGQNLNFASTVDEVSKTFSARRSELFSFRPLPEGRPFPYEEYP